MRGIEIALWCIAFGLTGPFMLPPLAWRIITLRRRRRRKSPGGG